MAKGDSIFWILVVVAGIVGFSYGFVVGMLFVSVSLILFHLFQKEETSPSRKSG